MPRLLVVTPYFHPRIGGAESYAYQIARRFAARADYQVGVVTGHSEPGSAQRETLEGIEIQRLPIWVRWSNTPINPLWLPQLRRAFRAAAPDLIHLHAPVPFMADVAAHAAGDVPTVLTYHAGSMVKGRLPVDALIRLYEDFALPALFRRVSALVAVSPRIAQTLMRRFAEKTHVIPPGVDLDRFRSAPLPETLSTVTYVGRVERGSEWKGIEDLLQAMPAVIRALPDARLEIVGGGNALGRYAARARALGIERAVTLCGPQTGISLVEAYRRAAVVVLPSKTDAESFGMVLIEAMACGRPVIGSRVGGIPQVIEDGRNGLLVPPGDAASLSSAILRVLGDRGLAQRLAERGVERAREFDWEIQLERYRTLFASLVGR